MIVGVEREGGEIGYELGSPPLFLKEKGRRGGVAEVVAKAEKRGGCVIGGKWKGGTVARLRVCANKSPQQHISEGLKPRILATGLKCLHKLTLDNSQPNFAKMVGW